MKNEEAQHAKAVVEVEKTKLEIKWKDPRRYDALNATLHAIEPVTPGVSGTVAVFDKACGDDVTVKFTAGKFQGTDALVLVLRLIADAGLLEAG